LSGIRAARDKNFTNVTQDSRLAVGFCHGRQRLRKCYTECQCEGECRLAYGAAHIRGA